MRRLVDHRPAAFVALAIMLALQGCGDHGSREPSGGADPVLRWNAVAIDASRLDHTPLHAGEQRTFGEQLGPTGTSRAFAIVHIAIADAVAMIDGSFATFFPEGAAPRDASLDAAVAQAAHDSIVELFPSQRAAFDTVLEADLAAIPEAPRSPMASPSVVPPPSPVSMRAAATAPS